MLTIQGGKQASESNYKPKFYTGAVTLTPLRFNPTRAELAEIKGITIDKVKEPNYISAMPDGRYKVIELLCKYNAGNHLKLSEPEPDRYISVRINATNRYNIAGTGSQLFINDSADTTYSKSLETLKNNPNMSWFTSNSIIRQCRVGEGMLYHVLTTLLNIVSTKDNKMKFTLGSEPTEFFDSLVLDDVSVLNNIVFDDEDMSANFRDKHGNMNTFTALIGISVSDTISDKTGLPMFNERIYTKNDNSKFLSRGVSGITKDVITSIQEGYTNKLIFANPSLQFAEFDIDKYFQEVLNSTTPVSIKPVTPTSTTSETDTSNAGVDDDDLPF